MVTHIGTKTIETKRLILRRFEYSNFQIRQLCFTYSFPDFEYFLNTFETRFWEARFYAGFRDFDTCEKMVRIGAAYR